MDTKQDPLETIETNNLEDGEAIEQAFKQMAVLYKSRCVQTPLGSNITIKEIKKEE
ncbi:MAG: hypothetical protein V2B20_18780 [Pseudomonadota bacterium]